MSLCVPMCGSRYLYLAARTLLSRSGRVVIYLLARGYMRSVRSVATMCGYTYVSMCIYVWIYILVSSSAHAVLQKRTSRNILARAWVHAFCQMSGYYVRVYICLYVYLCAAPQGKAFFYW